MPLDVVVLAAGQGKRMHSSLPKVLHPLAGRPLLAHVLEAARSLKPRRIVVVHGYGGEEVRAAFPGDDLDWALQAEQLGTGHAVRQALPHLAADAEILILYGDVPLVRAETLKRLLDTAQKGVAVLTAEVANPTGYGRIVRAAGGRVQRIVEQKDATPAEAAIREVNAGFFALRAAHLASWLGKLTNENAQKEYYLTDIVTLAGAEDVPVFAVKVEDRWEVAGVNSKQDLAGLERVVQHRQAARLLDAGVTLADPARIDVRGSLECGRDVFIDVNCVFEGRVVLGDQVRVGPNCVVRNTSVGARTEVRAYSHLDDAEIGERCLVGPYARLRPGASLADEVHIGNFVEVKATKIGARTKASHLTYLGDADIGSETNIGAGTITCNYDGYNKHRTRIGSRAFIGSDTALVAPVTVGDGAIIAAGSVITEDVPADALALARGRQENKPGRAVTMRQKLQAKRR
jgi:bifunctional UDP-N-acetylglucosamine pyrophosphorylase/glucosamine-1-phosphate N-acetyltransferase